MTGYPLKGHSQRAPGLREEMIELLPRLRRFARSLGNIDRFEKGTRLDSWMYKIARNLWIDAKRAERAQGTRVSDAVLVLVPGDDGRRVTEARLTLAATRRAIEELPDDQRSVLMLVDGLSYQDAAQVLSLPIGTVMSRLHRARHTRSKGPRMMIDDATLFAYLDGTLPESERQRVEAQIAGDPELARRVASHRALEHAAREAFADELREPVPAAWIAAIDDAMAASGGAEPIVIARERRGMRWSSWQAGAAIAAALVLGVAIGWTMQGTQGQLVTERAGALMASASVAGALDNSLSGVPVELSEGWVLEVELSLLGADGRFCREAVIHDAAAAQRILACRESEGWEIAGLARAAAPGEGYRQVGGDGSLDAVIETIGGEPLDAAGEKEAIVRGWRR